MCIQVFVRCPVERNHNAEAGDKNSGLVYRTTMFCERELDSVGDPGFADVSAIPLYPEALDSCAANNVTSVYCHGLAAVCYDCAEMKGQQGVFGGSGRPLLREDVATAGSKWPRALHVLQIAMLACGSGETEDENELVWI